MLRYRLWRNTLELFTFQLLLYNTTSTTKVSHFIFKFKEFKYKIYIHGNMYIGIRLSNCFYEIIIE